MYCPFTGSSVFGVEQLSFIRSTSVAMARAPTANSRLYMHVSLYLAFNIQYVGFRIWNLGLVYWVIPPQRSEE